MQAYGNDYVYIDAIHQELAKLPELARFVSDRHFAVGSDGMVLICPSEVSDFRMRMFNPDGSEGEMCGNALRSVAKYVYDHGFTDKTRFQIETFGGLQNIELPVSYTPLDVYKRQAGHDSRYGSPDEEHRRSGG